MKALLLIGVALIGVSCNHHDEMKQTYKYVDDNTEVMEFYGPDMQTGKQFKSMQITFKRNK